MTFLLLIGMLAGCGQQNADSEQSTEAVTDSQEETSASGEREITDMAGRTMTVPAEIDSVFSTGPVAAIYLYTLVPDKLLGWNYELNDIEKSIILEQYHDLPNFGIGIIGVAQPLQVGKGIPPHIGLNVNAHDVAGAGHKILCGTINQPQNEIQQGEL